jgi:hypothetical protein
VPRDAERPDKHSDDEAELREWTNMYLVTDEDLGRHYRSGVVFLGLRVTTVIVPREGMCDNPGMMSLVSRDQPAAQHVVPRALDLQVAQRNRSSC